jgi:hypothetical protein
MFVVFFCIQTFFYALCSFRRQLHPPACQNKACGKEKVEFLEFHSPFILFGWLVSKQQRRKFCSCLLLGRREPTNLAEGRRLVCLLPSASLPLALLRITLQDFLLCFAKKIKLE